MINIFGPEEVRARAPLSKVIECLEKAFGGESNVPPRQVVPVPGGTGERLLLQMPAFDANGAGMVKLATVFPDNTRRGIPTIQAAIVVFSDAGTPVAILDGTTVTRLRTGGASALASRYLSRPDSSHLVIVGTGALAPWMAAAHCTVRPITRISVCGRSSERVAATAVAIQARLPRDIDVVRISPHLVQHFTISEPTPRIGGSRKSAAGDGVSKYPTAWSLLHRHSQNLLLLRPGFTVNAARPSMSARCLPEGPVG